MTNLGGTLPMLKSVRAKLLLLLAVLSLPLLVVSLIQLRNYRRDLDEQAAATARIETNAAAGFLFSWLEDHPSYVKRSSDVPAQEAQALYSRLERDAGGHAGSAIVIFDAEGQPLALRRVRPLRRPPAHWSRQGACVGMTT